MNRFFLVVASCLFACSSSSSSPSPPSPVPDAAAPDDARAPDDGVAPDAGVDTGAGATCMPDDGDVEVTGGCLRGGTVGSLHSFLGVPYAAPPTKGLRWRPPAEPVAWTGVRMATVVSKACPQNSALVTGRTLDWDEDCLYLNVWTPSLDASAKLPVMVWIHGGGLVNGSGGESIYGGRYLAAGGVVAVTINYRLAQLGYLGHPALAAERGGRSGNFGLLDQIAALEWVRANAAKFGGDPANVTVYGESAGALSTCALLASPRAAGLWDPLESTCRHASLSIL